MAKQPQQDQRQFKSVDENNKLIGLVLAGGESRRMGQNKATLDRLGQSMLDYSVSLLKQAGCSKVLISGQNNQGISDLFLNKGPISGIYSAIQHWDPNNDFSLLVIPVDMPLLTKACLIHLLDATIDKDNAAFEESQLPLILRVNQSVRDYLLRCLSNDSIGVTPTTDKGRHLSIKGLLDFTQAKRVTCLNQQTLSNSNSPTEWQQAQMKFSSIVK